MKKIGLLGLICLFIAPLSIAMNRSNNGYYVGVFGGVANTVAHGLYALEPAIPITGISVIENTAHPYLFGGVIGYDWSGCNFPISTELMFVNINRQKYQVSNMYPFFAGGRRTYAEFNNFVIRTKAYLFNAIYHFEECNSFRPFFGAGLGMARVNTSGSFDSPITGFSHNGVWNKKGTTKFAYDLLLGLSYALCANFEVQFTYQFLSFRNIASDREVYDNHNTSGLQTLFIRQINMNNLFLGIKYFF